MKTRNKSCKFLLAIISILFTFSAKTQTNLIWGKQLGTDKSEYVMNHVVDSSGNIYICGKTTGNLEGTNKGQNDLFITKIDPRGKTIWTRQLGSKGDEDEQWSAIDNSGCVYITGSTTGDLAGTNFGKEDIFIVKYNPDGKLLWNRQFGTDSTDIGKGIYVDNKGYIWVTGTTAGKLGETAFGKMDGFLMKLDSKGNQLFVEQFGTVADEVSNAITGDNNSNIYVCGTTWGELGAKNKGLLDAFTAQFTNQGKLVKFNQFGTDSYDIPMAIMVDNEKNIYVGGTT